MVGIEMSYALETVIAISIVNQRVKMRLTVV